MRTDRIDPRLAQRRYRSARTLDDEHEERYLYHRKYRPGSAVPALPRRDVSRQDQGKVMTERSGMSRRQALTLPAAVITCLAAVLPVLCVSVPGFAATSAPGTPIWAALSGPAGEPYRLRVHIGTRVDRLMVTASGIIR